jgi:hypothetical protein
VYLLQYFLLLFSHDTQPNLSQHIVLATLEGNFRAYTNFACPSKRYCSLKQLPLCSCKANLHSVSATHKMKLIHTHLESILNSFPHHRHNAALLTLNHTIRRRMLDFGNAGTNSRLVDCPACFYNWWSCSAQVSDR